MPVAGIDEGRASYVLFTLRQVATTPQAKRVATDWLVALQLAQIAFDRLINNLRNVESHLQFWELRMRRGQHLYFLLANTGPAAFVQEVEQRLIRPSDLSAADQIEEKELDKPQAYNRKDPSRAGFAKRVQELNLCHSVQEPCPTSPQDTCQPSANFTATYSGEPKDGDGMNDAAPVEAALNVQIDRQADCTAHQALLTASCQPLSGPPSLRLPPLLKPRHIISNTGCATLLLASTLGFWLKLLVQVRSLQQANSHSRYGFQVVVNPGVVKAWKEGQQPAPGIPWLAGSRDLEAWTSMALEALVSSYREHILGPLLLVRDELFNTFRARRSIVSPAEWERDRDSLLRMLSDFQSDNASHVQYVQEGGEPAPDIDIAEQGMSTLMAVYEQELKHPIRNLVNGQLARSLLIQVETVGGIDRQADCTAHQALLTASWPAPLSPVTLSATLAALHCSGFNTWLWLKTSCTSIPGWLAAVTLRRGQAWLLRHLSVAIESTSWGLAVGVRDELFNTFRARRSIVSPAEWERDRDSLLRMLSDFQSDNASHVQYVQEGGEPAPDIDIAEQAVSTLMAVYEQELKHPIRNLVNGQLARSLLIQVETVGGFRPSFSPPADYSLYTHFRSIL
eukprot:jgi/Botrbrau1/19439/Bobra.0338s0061.1